MDFKVFSAPATTPRAAAWWRCASRAAREMSRRGEIDGYTEFVKIYGAKGLAWIKVNDCGQGRAKGCSRRSSRTCTTLALAEILKRTGAGKGPAT